MPYSFSLLSTFLIVMISVIQAQDISDLNRQRKEIQSRIQTTNTILKENSKNKTSTVSKIQGIDQNIKNKSRLIKLLDAELLALDSKTTTIQRHNDSLDKEHTRLCNQYAQMVVNSYYTFKKITPLLFIFNSRSFTELVKKVRFLQDIVSFKKTQIAKINENQIRLKNQKDLLDRTKLEKKQTLKTREREKQKLQVDQRQQQKLLNTIVKKEKQLKSELQKQQKLETELNAKISRLMQQTQKPTTLTKEQQLIEGDFIKNKGRLPWPVERGFICRPYGKYTDPIYKNVTVNNIGVYIQTVPNTPVRSIFNGEVTGCYIVANTYTVIIKHGNFFSVYSGLKKVNVKKGDKVTTKQNIGLIYTTEDNVSELYFLIYEGKTNLNPTLWITQ